MPDVVRVLEEGVCDKRGGDRESVGYNSMLSVEELSVLAPSHLVREGSSTQLCPLLGFRALPGSADGRVCVCGLGQRSLVWAGLDTTGRGPSGCSGSGGSRPGQRVQGEN